MVFVGFCSGFVASAVGIGGGVVTVPLLLIVCRLPMRNAVGISTIVMVFALGVSTVMWVARGWEISLTSLHLGYVVWPVSLCVAVPGIMLAWWSASVVSKVNQFKLQMTLAVILFLSGMNLLFGVTGMIQGYIQ